MRRITTGLAAWAVLAAGTAAPGAPEQDPPAPPRGEFPFAVMPERLPGPPRAEGNVPIGETQPPSTLPGRLFGPPRAQGESPERVLPPVVPPPALPPVLSRESVLGLPPMFSVPSIDPLQTTPADRRFLSSPFSAEILNPKPGGDAAGGGAGAQGRQPGDDLAAPTAPPAPGPAAPAAGAPLTLEQVLDSAFRTYPPFLSALQEIDIARGDLMAARGGFDLNANADARNWGLGNYKRYLYDIFLEQPTTLWGTKFFGGYRLGVGNWPIYYQYLQTNSGGAFVGGMETPLLKNGRIDAKRAKLWQQQIEIRKVEPVLAKQRISLVKDVTKAYVSWWAAGRRLAVAERLARVADERDRGLARQVELGSLAPIDRADSQRVVLQRQGQLVYARRKLQQSAIDLSLFLRDARCLPWIPDDRLAPESLPVPAPPSPAQLPEDLDVALRLRPELRSIRLQGQKADVQRQFAENQYLPSLNFYLYGEQNLGEQTRSVTKRDQFILESSLFLDVPLQRRAAKGQIAVANAALRQVKLQERFAADQIVAEVRDDFSAVQAAYAQVDLYRRSADINRRLESAERRKFALGTTTVLALALREQATADAVTYEIDATAEYLKALAEYRAALATDVGALAGR